MPYGQDNPFDDTYIFHDNSLLVESFGEDDESDEDSKEIDYPDGSELHWSDEEDSAFYRREASYSCPPLYSFYTTQGNGNMYLRTNRRHSAHPYKPKLPVHKRIHQRPATVQPKNERGDCSICLVEMNNPNSKVTLEYVYCSNQCGNLFHKTCIEEYHNTNQIHNKVINNKCPLCRTCSNFKIYMAPQDLKKQKTRPNVFS